jgi:hypothetical protein
VSTGTTFLRADCTPTDEELAHLGERAEGVLARYRESDRDPIVIEFAGSPKSGKSTTIDVIAHFFRRMGFKVRAPTEGASKRTPYHLKKDLVAFNLFTLNYAISELLDAYYNVDRPDLVILDRGTVDSLAWLRYLLEDGKLDQADFDTLRNFALLPLWRDRLSKVYLFTCAPEVSLERENAAKLTRRTGRAMNEKTLTAMRDQYWALPGKLEGEELPVTTVDTTDTKTPIGTSFQIAGGILDLFEGRVANA